MIANGWRQQPLPGAGYPSSIPPAEVDRIELAQLLEPLPIPDRDP